MRCSPTARPGRPIYSKIADVGLSGAVVVALLVVCDAPSVEGVIRFGIEPDYLAVVGDGVVVVAIVHISYAPIENRAWVFRIKSYGLTVVSDSALKIALETPSRSTGVPRTRIRWVTFDGYLVKVGDRRYCRYFPDFRQHALEWKHAILRTTGRVRSPGLAMMYE
jgi:hypothetical protein